MRKRPLRSLFAHPGLALGGTFLALLGVTGIAFSSWSTLQGARLEGIQAEFASVLDAREYVSGSRFSITPYCEDGFLPANQNDVLASAGELFFSFELKNDASLREYAGEKGLLMSLDVSCSAEFLSAFPSSFDAVTVSVGNSPLPSGDVSVSSSGNDRRVSFRISLPAGGSSLTIGMKLSLSAGGTGDAFSSAASALDPDPDHGGTPLSVSIFLGDRA